MRIFTINEKIQIVCDWHKTRNAFKHTATLIINGNDIETVKICYRNRTWERFEFESVLEKLIDETESLSADEKKASSEYVKNYRNESNSELKTIAAVATMGEVFGKTQKEKNDWKTRMIKAGLEHKGLIMPDDWDSLDEDTKEKRLNSVLVVLEGGDIA